MKKKLMARQHCQKLQKKISFSNYKSCHAKKQKIDT